MGVLVDVVHGTERGPQLERTDMATVIKADDQATFQREVLDSTVPVVVDFWAAWCGPCRTVAPEVEALADKYGTSIKVVKVDVDANQAVAGRYGIRGIPTIGLFEAGKLTKQAVGARPRHAIESELGLTRFAIAEKK
jgi:thioredoxin 1